MAGPVLRLLVRPTFVGQWLIWFRKAPSDLWLIVVIVAFRSVISPGRFPGKDTLSRESCSRGGLADREIRGAVICLFSPDAEPRRQNYPEGAQMAERVTSGSLGGRSPRLPASKFCPPRASTTFVRRPRLLEQLDKGELRRLSLVVGSAGAGKTALLVDWAVARAEWPCAWLNCDVADTDPVRFFAGIIEAVRRASGQPGVGEDARQLLNLDGEVSADVVSALADDLEELDRVKMLVVDDFHLTGEKGAEVLALLLDYRPPSFQFVVATRVDPHLRLNRMRANAELLELRDRDLSFTHEETRLFLAQFGVQLSDPDLFLVQRRSEGWAAGLQMAAISIHQSDKPTGAAQRVDLNRHTVAGYFLEEVLNRQPPEVADFMLATSVLDELSAPLCTALCGEGAGALLDLLYRAHMFVTMVDQEERTYRYHQLITEVLRAELHARHPGRDKLLHATAARHLADAGEIGAAVRHLLAAGDPAGAFRLLNERVIQDYFANPTVGSGLDLDEVQPSAFAGLPEILVPLATELLVRGVFERGSLALELAQRAGVDPASQPELAAKLAVVSSQYCAITGALGESLALRQRAQDMGVNGIDEWLAGTDVVAMYCYTYMGELGKARQLTETVSAAGLGPPATDVLCPAVLSQVALIEGRLEEAGALAAGALSSARRLHLDRHYFAFSALRTTALLALERRDLASAAALTEQVLGMLGGGRPSFDYLAQLDRARVWAASGNPEEALASLPAARTCLKAEASVLFAQADELEARFRLALGDKRRAESAAERLPTDRRVVVSAIIALAADDPGRAATALGEAATDGASVRYNLELSLLRANIAIAQSSPHTRALVREALLVIERYGFLQTVLDTAPRLVDHLVNDGGDYARTTSLRSLVAAALEQRKLRPYPQKSSLPDELTEAEVRVLEKLPAHLTYVDMASELHLSLNTVKTHLRHTYMKLGVTSRSSAIKRATSLGLL